MIGKESYFDRTDSSLFKRYDVLGSHKTVKKDLSDDPAVIYLQLSIGSKKLIDATAKNVGALQDKGFRSLLIATAASMAVAREDVFPSQYRPGGLI